MHFSFAGNYSILTARNTCICIPVRSNAAKIVKEMKELLSYHKPIILSTQNVFPDRTS
ncbi:MAG: hypothetical protein HC849_30490 [Oscillatoriales cyanobacterium RU_3_3]|nr:hypothetical protein [Microcoleus sp. SU_5_6]NJM63518.1 hypothetical protein [Oscillatoriales cyanobacterium RU_3_3]